METSLCLLRGESGGDGGVGKFSEISQKFPGGFGDSWGLGSSK